MTDQEGQPGRVEPAAPRSFGSEVRTVAAVLLALVNVVVPLSFYVGTVSALAEDSSHRASEDGMGYVIVGTLLMGPATLVGLLCAAFASSRRLAFGAQAIGIGVALAVYLYYA